MCTSQNSPPERIGLANAFAFYFSLVTPDLNHLEDALSRSIERAHFEALSDDAYLETQAALNEAVETYENAQRRAHRLFRERLISGDLKAYVENSETNELVFLAASEWHLRTFDLEPFIASDFLSPDDFDNPGPMGAVINGICHPIFLIYAEFCGWLTREFGISLESGTTRPRFSGGYLSADMPLLREMQALVRSGVSTWNAAGQLARRAAGGGSEPSKQQRLFRHYRKHFAPPKKPLS